MMTLDEAKKFITGVDDYLISYCIPLVEDLIIRYCNNDFTVIESEISGTTNGTTSIAVVDNIITSGKIYVDNYGVYNVLSGTTTTIYIDESIDSDSVMLRKIRYPRGIKLVFEQLLKYHVEKRTIGMKQEQVDDYSVSWGDDIPLWIKHDLNKFSKYKIN
ncbi:MAG: hypothetical protein ACRCW9_03900 [Cetobacterium sp.]